MWQAVHGTAEGRRTCFDSSPAGQPSERYSPQVNYSNAQYPPQVNYSTAQYPPQVSYSTAQSPPQVNYRTAQYPPEGNYRYYTRRILFENQLIHSNCQHKNILSRFVCYIFLCLRNFLQRKGQSLKSSPYSISSHLIGSIPIYQKCLFGNPNLSPVLTY